MEFSWGGLIKPRGEHSPPGTLKAVQVTLVKPVAYLKYRVIAALKLRTTNKKGRHLSTAEAIRLLEVYGVETPQGVLHAPPAVLKKSTVNYDLNR